MAGAVSRWLGSVEDLPEIVQRLLRVQIENDTAVKVIQRYDSEDTSHLAPGLETGLLDKNITRNPNLS
ncbi:hypothetical protein DSM106972_058760 [Dulcicalothrix desertica PCC 7102]|uniref:Uncharacterized protein n=1 Tax=Dulcicalothrix desertica PCC 7102 TaxID=232991 RepID=A0A3S1AJW5_9CYAN|nr:hypothetical protein [Dulcicalothrix desertica]RUT02398.1 hypothetical protein DSM106972_058760 [Dulcicalothrix desertica PCC 7102]